MGVIIFVVTLVLASCDPVDYFIQTVGFLDHTMGNSIDLTTDGGYIVIGSSFISKKHIVVTKFANNGSVEWIKRVGGFGDYEGTSITQVSTSEYVLSGVYPGGEPVDSRVFIGKYNSTSSSLTMKMWDSFSEPCNVMVQRTMDEGYILSANDCQGSLGSTYIVKYDSNLDDSWSKELLGLFHSLKRTSDGGYVLVGERRYSSVKRICVARLTSGGDLEWYKNYTGIVEQRVGYGMSVDEAQDGGFVISGVVKPNDESFIAKLTSTGEVSWFTKIGSNLTNLDLLIDIRQTSDGGVISVGHTYSPTSSSNINMLVVKLNETGGLQWIRICDLGDEEYARAVRELDNGDFIITGKATGSGHPLYSILLMRIESDGKTCHESCGLANYLDVIYNNNTLVAGNGGDSSLLENYTLVELSPLQVNLTSISPLYYRRFSECASHGGCNVDFDPVKNWTNIYCNCQPEYFGGYCTVTTCGGVYSNFTEEICFHHGTCEEFEKCECQQDYFGELCNITTCFLEFSNDTEAACSGSDRGVCVEHNVCSCHENYFGERCEVTTCSSLFSNDTTTCCSGHGECIRHDRCACFPDYYGMTCNVTQCYQAWSNDTLSVCTSHGSCLEKDNCTCYDTSEWVGDECEVRVCFGWREDDEYNVCSNHGKCLSPNECTCSQDFYSAECVEMVKDSSATFHENNRKGIYYIVVSYFVLLEDITDEVLIQRYMNGSFDCTEIVENGVELGMFGFNSSECYFSMIDIAGFEVTDQLTLVILDDQQVEDTQSDFENALDGRENITLNILPVSSPYSRYAFPVNVVIKRDTQSDDEEDPTQKNMADEDEDEDGSLGRAIIASVTSVSSLVLVLCLCFCCLCVICVVLVGLMCCILITLLFGVAGIALIQKRRLKKFEQLEDIELLVKEQIDDQSGEGVRINRKLFLIEFDDVKVECIIGEGGSQAIVFKANWKGHDVAFKCFKTKLICSDQHSYREFEREVEMMASLSHPNIIRFYGATVKPPRVGIVMEYCELGEVLDFVKKFREENGGRGYPITQKCRMAREICSSLEYCHSRGIIHRDLKCENVLADAAEQCKLMDFGVSRLIDVRNLSKTKSVGTNCYMAPEVVMGEYDEKCDVFSFGVLFYVLITELAKPYGDNDDRVELKVASDPNFRPSIHVFEKSLGEELQKYEWIKNVIENCWNHDQTKRMSFTELVQLLENSFRTNEELPEDSLRHTLEEKRNEELEVEAIKKEWGWYEKKNSELKKRVIELENKLEFIDF